MKITTKDIAEKCGVSRITVDRALNGRPGISEKKRKEVLAVAKEMGYRPHRLAQALVRGESKSLGIIVFDLKNTFFSQVVESFQRTAHESGYVTYIMLSNNTADIEKDCVEQLLSRSVDGIALVSTIKDETYRAYIESLQIPLLSVMNRISSTIPHLGFNDFRAMYDMTQNILSRGYERLIYVSPPLHKSGTNNMATLVERKRGFETAVNETGRTTETLLLTDKNYGTALDQFDFRSGPRTAIICSSDIYAIEIRSRLQKRGLRTPFDYGLSGFDNIPMLHAFEPNIATVSLNLDELGKTCASFLIDWAKGARPKDSALLPYEILEGQTIL